MVSAVGTKRWTVLVVYLLAALLLVSACTQRRSTDSPGEAEDVGPDGQEAGDTLAPAEELGAYEHLVAGLDGESPDYDQLLRHYRTQLQSLVQRRDQQDGSRVDNQIVTALEAGATGELPAAVVAETVDKLLQRVFFFSLRHEFQEAAAHWDDRQAVQDEIEEARTYYDGVLAGTVHKRDAVYGTDMQGVIDAGFNSLQEAVRDNDKTEFAIAHQIVDKTLIKTFYLAVGGRPHGYAYKLSRVVDEEPAAARKQQAEAWAFYQSIRSYLADGDAQAAALIEDQLNLENQAAAVEPETVHRAFIRAIAAKARGYVTETLEHWGGPEAAVEAAEAAMFVRMLDQDVPRMPVDVSYQAMETAAQSFMQAARSGDRAQAESLAEETLIPALDDILSAARRQ